MPSDRYMYVASFILHKDGLFARLGWRGNEDETSRTDSDLEVQPAIWMMPKMHDMKIRKLTPQVIKNFNYSSVTTWQIAHLISYLQYFAHILFVSHLVKNMTAMRDAPFFVNCQIKTCSPASTNLRTFDAIYYTNTFCTAVFQKEFQKWLSYNCSPASSNNLPTVIQRWFGWVILQD